MLRLSTLFAGLVLSLAARAEEKKGIVVEFAGMKSTTPADWKEEKPSNKMRKAQYKLPKAEKDSEDVELALFEFPGGAGTDKQNLERQLNKFVAEGRKENTSKIRVGPHEATYQDVTGTFKKKKDIMAADFTPAEGYRQLYVLFEIKDGKQYYLTLLGPSAGVEKHKKDFEEWLKNFK